MGRRASLWRGVAQSMPQWRTRVLACRYPSREPANRQRNAMRTPHKEKWRDASAKLFFMAPPGRTIAQLWVAGIVVGIWLLARRWLSLFPAKMSMLQVPHGMDAYLRWAKAQAEAHWADPTKQHMTLLMGNEAGDLDSAASAIALSYVMNHEPRYFMERYGLPPSVYVPVIQTPRTQLTYRRENLHVYQMIHTTPEALLCVDDLGDISSSRFGTTANVSLGLVDHPRLSAAWGDKDRRVDVIVDHHEDDGSHPEAKLRAIRSPSADPVGSAASLVAYLISQAQGGRDLPTEVADLLLSAIVLDTRNLKMQPSGKATDVDVQAYAYLRPHSSFGPSEVDVRNGRVDTSHTKAWNEDLQRIKNDVSHLDTHALLSRDLKMTSMSGLHIGLAAVPLSFSSWISGAYRTNAPVDTVREEVAEREWTVWWTQLAGFMRDKGMNMAVVLLSYREAMDGKTKSRRDLALAYFGEARFLEQVASSLEAFGSKRPFHDGVSLELETWKGQRRVPGGKRERNMGIHGHQVSSVPGMTAVVWRQRNTNANRKIVQPALLRVLHHLL